MREFFRIETTYNFEWDDLRCFITVINVVLIMHYGLSICWFGFAVAVFGVIKDLTVNRKVSALIMHLSNVCLNAYLLSLIYLK